MALAPLVYTIWNRVMRFDPQDPIWPNRDRFVLSNGHASMLLWSVLHLTDTQAVNAEYETLGQAVGHAGRHPALSPARTARRPAIPNTTWFPASRPPPVRSGKASPPASAWRSRRKWLAARYNRPGFDDLRLQHLRRLRRRLHDGRRWLGSGVARRPSRPRQPLLDLRQQPHHDRRQHAASRSPKTSPPASRLMAGTFCASATPTTSSASNTRWQRFAKRKAGRL